MPWFRRRAQRAGGDLSPAEHGVALAGDALLGDERDEHLGRAVGPSDLDRLRADEARVLLHAPAQAGLDGTARLHQVVAVQVVTDLQAQRVARAEADRDDARVQQRVPDLDGADRVDQQLHAVLAGVARAAHEHVLDPGHGEAGGAEPLGQLTLGEVRDDPARLGPLDREHRVVVQGVLEADVEGLRLLAEPRQVLFVVGRVRDRQVVVLTELVGEEVVQDAPVLLAQHAVLRAAVGDLGDVVGEDALQEVLGLRARGLDLAHVRDVEDAGLVRTARCSSLMPAYWTGISQPANGTSLAPAATWRS